MVKHKEQSREQRCRRKELGSIQYSHRLVMVVHFLQKLNLWKPISSNDTDLWISATCCLDGKHIKKGERVQGGYSTSSRVVDAVQRAGQSQRHCMAQWKACSEVNWWLQTTRYTRTSSVNGNAFSSKKQKNNVMMVAKFCMSMPSRQHEAKNSHINTVKWSKHRGTSSRGPKNRECVVSKRHRLLEQRIYVVHAFEQNIHFKKRQKVDAIHLPHSLDFWGPGYWYPHASFI